MVKGKKSPHLLAVMADKRRAGGRAQRRAQEAIIRKTEKLANRINKEGDK